jgi:hypothetical protein
MKDVENSGVSKRKVAARLRGRGSSCSLLLASRFFLVQSRGNSFLQGRETAALQNLA